MFSNVEALWGKIALKKHVTPQENRTFLSGVNPLKTPVPTPTPPWNGRQWSPRTLSPGIQQHSLSAFFLESELCI